MNDCAIDLRRRSAPMFRITVPTVAVCTVVAVFVAADTRMSTVAQIIAGFVAAGLLATTVVLVRIMRRTWRLMIDHEGIRIDAGRSKLALRLAWSELSGVGLLVKKDEPNNFIFYAIGWPPPMVSAVLELVPADAEAVRRHPALRLAWQLGRERAWRVALGLGLELPPVKALVLRHRPELWRGERPGSLLSK